MSWLSILEFGIIHAVVFVLVCLFLCFGKSAVKAAIKLKYNPRVINGVAVEVPGVLYKFTFAGFTED